MAVRAARLWLEVWGGPTDWKLPAAARRYVRTVFRLGGSAAAAACAEAEQDRRRELESGAAAAGRAARRAVQSMGAGPLFRM